MSARDSGPRLGRGLAALLGETASAEAMQARDGIQPVPVELLEPGPFQPRARMDPTLLDELAESIRVRGVLQPLLARPHPDGLGRYQIIAGERRWRAAQAAGLHEVPVLVRSLADAEAMAASLVENLQRQDLDPIEEAEGFSRLMREFGMTQDSLAQTVGKSRSHIANTLRLLNLPDTVKAEVRNGALSAGHARALLSHPEPEKAALAVIARGLNVRQTEALAARPETAAIPAVQSPADGATRALEQDLADRLGLRVQISFDGKGGTLRIRYRSLDQLDGIIELLRRE
ncbi:MAG: ParB/RepB/Spo0J family partition protein [Alphaproteobacteria bacterium]|nr:ParB/RepB/Spo0J family partition protein [Alphaproteobacteria bacterium]